MMRRRITITGLFVLLLFLAVSPVFAQTSTDDLNLDDVLDALSPRDGDQFFLDILLYLIFFIGLINSFLIPDKQLLPSMLNFTVIGLAVVSKLLIGDHASAVLDPCDLPVLPINAAIFVLPLITAGMLRPVKGKPSKAMFPSIIVGLLGGGYFFLFWALEQRDACEGRAAFETMNYSVAYIRAFFAI